MNLTNLTIQIFFIVCPLVFLAGYVDAIAGGGGLISLPAYFLAGLPPHMAIATNKMSSAMGTSLATWRYAKKGYIPWKQAIFCIVSAFAGSNLGAHLALLLDEKVFRMVLLVVLPVIAVYVMKGKSLDTEHEAYSMKKTTLLSMCMAFVIGIYDGFYGPGTGTFLILGLTGLAHMKLNEANGISKAINLTTNLTSLSVFLLNGKVILILGLTAGLFNVAGSYLGTKSFDRGGAGVVKKIIIAVLCIFFVKTLWQ